MSVNTSDHTMEHPLWKYLKGETKLEEVKSEGMGESEMYMIRTISQVSWNGENPQKTSSKYSNITDLTDILLITKLRTIVSRFSVFWTFVKANKLVDFTNPAAQKMIQFFESCAPAPSPSPSPAPAPVNANVSQNKGKGKGKETEESELEKLRKKLAETEKELAEAKKELFKKVPSEYFPRLPILPRKKGDNEPQDFFEFKVSYEFGEYQETVRVHPDGNMYDIYVVLKHFVRDYHAPSRKYVNKNPEITLNRIPEKLGLEIFVKQELDGDPVYVFPYDDYEIRLSEEIRSCIKIPSSSSSSSSSSN